MPFDPDACLFSNKNNSDNEYLSDIFNENLDIEQQSEDSKNTIKIIDGKYQCPECKKLFKKLRYVDDHRKRYCKMNINYDNIYTYDTKTFGINKYGKGGGDIYIVQTDF